MWSRGLIGLPLVLAMVLAVAACSHREAEIYRDPDIVIGPAATYALTPTLLGARPEELDPRVHNALLHGRISSAITATLAAKGYRQSSPEAADFLVHFRIGVRTVERNVTGFVWRLNPARSSSTILTVTPAGTMEMTEGTLLIELVDRQTGAVLYRAEARADDVTPWDSSEVVVTGAVQALLQDI
jgi:hypothetical protein